MSNFGAKTSQNMKKWPNWSIHGSERVLLFRCLLYRLFQTFSSFSAKKRPHVEKLHVGFRVLTDISFWIFACFNVKKNFSATSREEKKWFWAPFLRFFQVGVFFSDFQDFGVIKSTFLIFLNHFWKFWAQILDQWRIWAEKSTLLFEFYRIKSNLVNFGFLSIS